MYVNHNGVLLTPTDSEILELIHKFHDTMDFITFSFERLCKTKWFKDYSPSTLCRSFNRLIKAGLLLTLKDSYHQIRRRLTDEAFRLIEEGYFSVKKYMKKVFGMKRPCNDRGGTNSPLRNFEQNHVVEDLKETEKSSQYILSTTLLSPQSTYERERREPPKAVQKNDFKEEVRQELEQKTAIYDKKEEQTSTSGSNILSEQYLRETQHNVYYHDVGDGIISMLDDDCLTVLNKVNTPALIVNTFEGCKRYLRFLAQKGEPARNISAIFMNQLQVQAKRLYNVATKPKVQRTEEKRVETPKASEAPNVKEINDILKPVYDKAHELYEKYQHYHGKILSNGNEVRIHTAVILIYNLKYKCLVHRIEFKQADCEQLIKQHVLEKL